MIPHGRDAVDAVTAAAILGISVQTWHNTRCADALGLRPLNSGRRKLLYDRAQVEAARDGRELPTWPVGDEHPDDLLDEHEAADLLGVKYATVRKDRHDGRLPGWVLVCGVPHIKRSTLKLAAAARPGRGRGGGRPRKYPAAEDRRAG